MKKLMIFVLFCVAIMTSCSEPKTADARPNVRSLFDDETLRQRCIKLHVTCDVQWQARQDSPSVWMGSAHNNKPWPESSDWWFSFEPTRAEAIDKLCVVLGGAPTNPANPIPEVIWKESPPAHQSPGS